MVSSMFKKNKNKKALTIIGISIIIIVLLLCISPFMKKNSNEVFDERDKIGERDTTSPEENITPNYEVENEEIWENSENDKTTKIYLGVNTLIDGTGAIMDGENVLINEEGTYRITGTLLNAKLYIDTPQNVKLIFENVTFRGNTSMFEIKNVGSLTLTLENNNYMFGSLENPIITNDFDLALEGNGSLLILSNTSEQPKIPNVVSFHLNESIKATEQISIATSEGEAISEFISDSEYKNIAYMRANLENKEYKLYKITNDAKEEITPLQ